MIYIRCNKDCAYTIKASALVYVQETEKEITIVFEGITSITKAKDETFTIYEVN